MRLVRSVVAAVMLLLGLGSAAWAKDAAWASNDQGEVGLVAAVSAVGDSGRVQMGLSFKLKPGWKIYWRSPGDAGLPPTVDWKGSDNLSDVEMSWPGPERFSIAGLETVGYKDEVVLPFIALLNDPAQPLSLRAAVDYLACDVICVPLHVDLALDLPTGPAASTPEAHVIGRFLSAVPGQGAAKGLTLIRAAATDDGMLKVVVGANPPLTHPDLLVERVDQMQFTKPTVRLDQGGRKVVFLVKPVPKTGEGDLRDKPVTLTVVDAALNKDYANLRANGASLFRGTTLTVAGVEETQAAWLKYRDAWRAYEGVVNPTVSGDAVVTQIERERLTQLHKLSTIY